MTEIRLTGRFRLVRQDDRNWRLQELREPATDGRGGDAADGSARWRDTGNYFQRLDSALSHVYERALREDDGSAAALADALSKARQIAQELRASAGGLA